MPAGSARSLRRTSGMREIVRAGAMHGASYDGAINDYFLVRVRGLSRPRGSLTDEQLAAENVTGLRWWSPADIAGYQGSDLFGPRDLGVRLATLLRDGRPSEPVRLGRLAGGGQVHLGGDPAAACPPRPSGYEALTSRQEIGQEQQHRVGPSRAELSRAANHRNIGARHAQTCAWPSEASTTAGSTELSVPAIRQQCDRTRRGTISEARYVQPHVRPASQARILLVCSTRSCCSPASAAGSRTPALASSATCSRTESSGATG